MPEYIDNLIYFKVNETIRSQIDEAIQDFKILVDLMNQDITKFKNKYDDIITTFDSKKLDKVSNNIKLVYLYFNNVKLKLELYEKLVNDTVIESNSLSSFKNDISRNTAELLQANFLNAIDEAVKMCEENPSFFV